jgi:ribosomal protein S18 acetylase RimI-like enzyme
MNIRKARPDDAPALARLIDIAGEGIPSWLWSRSAEPGQSAEQVGCERAARAEGGFSYRNARVCVDTTGHIVGMLLSYRQPDPYELPDLAELPAVVRPLVELEAAAPGTWYVNALATFPESRGLGAGTRLMGLAESMAREAGVPGLSLIVAEENAGAKRLYERLGYRVEARAPIVPWPGAAHGGDWLLMVRAL